MCLLRSVSLFFFELNIGDLRLTFSLFQSPFHSCHFIVNFRSSLSLVRITNKLRAQNFERDFARRSTAEIKTGQRVSSRDAVDRNRNIGVRREVSLFWWDRKGCWHWICHFETPGKEFPIKNADYLTKQISKLKRISKWIRPGTKFDQICRISKSRSNFFIKFKFFDWNRI